MGDTLVFDDGSSITTDASGAVVGTTDSSGTAVAVQTPNSGITQQFFGLLTNGVNSLIGAASAKVAAIPVGVTPSQSNPSAQPVTAATLTSSPAAKSLLLLALGFIVLKKFF